MKKINIAQIRKIHGLLTKLCEMEYKADMVSGITNNRTSSCKQLSFEEAQEWIQNLQERFDEASKSDLNTIFI